MDNSMQLNVEVVIGILLITLFLFSFLLYLFLRASFDCQSHCKAMQNQTNNFNQILDFSIDFLSVGNRLDQQPKILEGGQPRWSPDSSMYIAYNHCLRYKYFNAWQWRPISQLFSALLHESRTSKVRNFAKTSVSVGQEQYPIRATRKSRNWSMSPKWVQVSHKYHKKIVETGLYRQNGYKCGSMLTWKS